MQSGQVRWNQESNSKSPRKKGKNVDNRVQHGISKNKIFSSDIYDLAIKLLGKGKKKIYKEITQNERLKEKKEREKQQEQKEKIPQNQQKQREYHINGEADLNRVICKDRLQDNFDRILNDSNTNYGSKLWTRDEKDGNYHIVQ